MWVAAPEERSGLEMKIRQEYEKNKAGIDLPHLLSPQHLLNISHVLQKSKEKRKEKKRKGERRENGERREGREKDSRYKAKS